MAVSPFGLLGEFYPFSGRDSGVLRKYFSPVRVYLRMPSVVMACSFVVWKGQL